MLNIKLSTRFAIAVLLLFQSTHLLAIHGKLSLNSPVPQAGRNIQLNYLLYDKPEQAIDLRAALIYYTLNDINSFFAEDVSIVRQNGGKYTGSFKLPKDAIAFALRFRAGNTADTNNGKGYLYAAYNGDRPVKGSDAGMALLHAYGNVLGFANQRDTAIALLQRAFKQHPAEALRFEHHYYYLLTLRDKDAAYPVLERRAGILLADARSVADYEQARTLYQLAHNFKAADSTLKAGSKKYPQSDLAIMEYDKEFNQYDSLQNMLNIYSKFEKEYDVPHFTDKLARTYSFWSSFIAARYVNLKEYAKAVYYTGHINAPSLLGYRIYYLSYIANAMLENNMGVTPLGDSLLQSALQAIQVCKNDPAGHKVQNETVYEYSKAFRSETEAPVLDIYAKVLALKGNYREALACQEKVMAIMQWLNPVYNEHYIDYLVKCGQYNTAFENARLIFVTENTNPHFRELLRQAYIHENGSDKDFRQFITDMENPIKKQLHDSLARQQLDMMAPAFSVTDMQGRPVSIASLRGKVIVVDFWATWCTPCKAAMPTLQRAVNQYKQDTGVVFLMVNTWETVPQEERLKLINNLMAAKKYALPIVLDQLKELGSRSYFTAGDYEIKGLPTKLVINTRGQIQFRNIGFDGNEDKLLNEIVEMIGMARK